MMRTSITFWTFVFTAASIGQAFLTKSRPNAVRDPTRLFLEDWVADLIDGELKRQSHKEEYETEWMEKNRAAVVSRMESDFVPVMDIDVEDIRQRRRDENMARKSPEKYCADRCLSTGNCDVYEDFFELSPEKVIEFCVECVLSDEEEPCDIPEGFYEKLMP